MNLSMRKNPCANLQKMRKSWRWFVNNQSMRRRKKIGMKRTNKINLSIRLRNAAKMRVIWKMTIALRSTVRRLSSIWLNKLSLYLTFQAVILCRNLGNIPTLTPSFKKSKKSQSPPKRLRKWAKSELEEQLISNQGSKRWPFARDPNWTRNSAKKMNKSKKRTCPNSCLFPKNSPAVLHTSNIRLWRKKATKFLCQSVIRSVTNPQVLKDKILTPLSTPKKQWRRPTSQVRWKISSQWVQLRNKQPCLCAARLLQNCNREILIESREVRGTFLLWGSISKEKNVSRELNKWRSRLDLSEITGLKSKLRWSKICCQGWKLKQKRAAKDNFLSCSQNVHSQPAN